MHRRNENHDGKLVLSPIRGVLYCLFSLHRQAECVQDEGVHVDRHIALVFDFSRGQAEKGQ